MRAPLPFHGGGADFWNKLLNNSVILIATGSEEPALLQAIKLGLLGKIEALFQTPTAENLRFAFTIFRGLLRFPSAMQKAREAKLFPDLLLQAADSNDHETMVSLATNLFDMLVPEPCFVAEALQAGVLKKLKQAREKVKRQVKLRLQLDPMVDPLEVLVKLPPSEIVALQVKARAGGSFMSGGRGKVRFLAFGSLVTLCVRTLRQPRRVALPRRVC